MEYTTALDLAGTTLAGYFAIMNPVANTPIFISLTEGDDAATKRTVALRSLMVAFGIIVVVSLAGNLLFKLFGISIETLRITGGIVVFIIGYHMLQGSGAHSHKPCDADVEESKDAQLSVAVSALAIPMLAGPGTIATAMNYAVGGWLHVAISLASFAVICGADLRLLPFLRTAGGIPRQEWHECGDAAHGTHRRFHRSKHAARRSGVSPRANRLKRQQHRQTSRGARLRFKDRISAADGCLLFSRVSAAGR
jgi:multiple antibiotic resistance protein